MTGVPDSMWRSPARLIQPDHHCSHSHEHTHWWTGSQRSRSRVWEMSRIVKVPSLDYDGSSKSKRTKTKATSSGSRATEAEKSAARPSRSREPKSVVSSVSAVGRPSSDGSDRHRSRSADRKRRHGADRRQDFPTPPSWQGPAVRFARQYRLPSTRQRWSILCLCGHCYSDGWTRVRLQIPGQPGCTVVSACYQTWLNTQEIKHAV